MTGSATQWLKLEVREAAFVVGGWTEPKGTRTRFGLPHSGQYSDAGLTHVGDVGTGFSGAELDRVVWRLLEPLATTASRLAVKPKKVLGKPHWVQPVLVAQVRYTR